MRCDYEMELPWAFGDKDKGMLEKDSLVIGNGSQIEGKLLGALQTNFLQVQTILDQNRLLINDINQNHESKIPDNLSRNVGLIRELNDNIRRIVDLYGNLSVLFADFKDADSDGKRGHKRNRQM